MSFNIMGDGLKNLAMGILDFSTVSLGLGAVARIGREILTAGSVSEPEAAPAVSVEDAPIPRASTESAGGGVDDSSSMWDSD